MFNITCTSAVTASRCADGVAGFVVTGSAIGVFVPYAQVVLPPVFYASVKADDPIKMKWPVKDPATERDYGLDWSAVLQLHEKIISSVWLTPDGITVFDSKITPDGKWAIAWLRGGTPDTLYQLLNKITTNRGMVEERVVQLTVREL